MPMPDREHMRDPKVETGGGGVEHHGLPSTCGICCVPDRIKSLEREGETHMRRMFLDG